METANNLINHFDLAVSPVLKIEKKFFLQTKGLETKICLSFLSDSFSSDDDKSLNN